MTNKRSFPRGRKKGEERKTGEEEKQET